MVGRSLSHFVLIFILFIRCFYLLPSYTIRTHTHLTDIEKPEKWYKAKRIEWERKKTAKKKRKKKNNIGIAPALDKQNSQNRWPIKIEKFKTRWNNWQNEYKIKSVHHNDNTDRAPHKTNSNSTKILSPTFNWHFILGFMFVTDGKTNRITKEKRVCTLWNVRYDREHRKRDALYQAAWCCRQQQQQQYNGITQTKFIRNIDRYTCANSFFFFFLLSFWTLY